METISKGTKIQAAGRTWTVIAAANGRYVVEFRGRSYSIPCNELHADLASGKAVRS